MVRARGLMTHPVFDAETNTLVEGELRIDLLNVWHVTHQLEHPDTDATLERWIAPQHLGLACSLGRVDAVATLIAAGSPVDGADYGGDPIAAAIEAWVVTPLHVQCVERLFAAGAKATLTQFQSVQAESTGTGHDRAIIMMLVEHARSSDDPEVRARGEGWARLSEARSRERR